MASNSDRLPKPGAPASSARMPTTTASPARVQLYQPSQRPCGFTEWGPWHETPWGRCRVRGRLGQRHADIMESIMWCAERTQRMADGAVFLLVDPAHVRITLSDGGYSGQRLWVLMTEIMSAVVEIQTASWHGLGHLIDEVVASSVSRRNPLPGADARGLWRVRIGACGLALLDHDVHLRYDPSPIARLQHGVSQAVARHVLTHQSVPSGGWILDKLLASVGVNAPDLRNARRKLRQDADRLRAMGIHVIDNRVTRFKQVPRIGQLDDVYCMSRRQDAVSKRPDGVSQRPDGVSQRPGGVSQRLGACSVLQGLQAPSAAASRAAARTTDSTDIGAHPNHASRGRGPLRQHGDTPKGRIGLEPLGRIERTLPLNMLDDELCQFRSDHHDDETGTL